MNENLKRLFKIILIIEMVFLTLSNTVDVFSLSDFADTTAPKILSVELKEDGNTLVAGNTLHFEVVIEDESTISEISIHLEHEISKVKKVVNFKLKDTESGTYTHTFSIPSTMSSGKWHVHAAGAKDEYGNGYNWNYSFKDIHFHVEGNKLDVTAPEILSVELKEEGNTLVAGNTLHFEVVIEDESTISEISIHLEHEISKVKKVVNFKLKDTESGTYTHTFSIPSTMSSGKWHVHAAGAKDEYGNGYNWNYSFKDIHFHVEGNKLDVTAPEILSVELKEEGNTLVAGNTLHFEVVIEDESTISEISIHLEHEISKVKKVVNFKLKDTESGTYTHTFSIPSTMSSGKWHVHAAGAKDEYGNGYNWNYSFKDIHFHVEYGTHLLEAIEAVVNAENSKLITDIENASILVEALENSKDKDSLLNRLSVIREIADFTIEIGETIKLGFNTTNTPEVNWSIDDPLIAKITNTGIVSFSMPGFSRESHSADIVGLKSGTVTLIARRSDGALLSSTVIEVVVNHDESLIESENLVIKTEESLSVLDFNKAQDKVYNLNDSIEKTELQKRLDAIHPIIKLNESKLTGILELDSYVDSADYTRNTAALAAAISSGKEKIEAATSPEEVTTALADAKAAIDKIKSDAEIIAEFSFSDVAASKWYYGYVLMLAEKDIVGGFKGTNEFRPDNKVTREQASKMIALAAGINYEGKVADFKDVNKKGWASPFIAALEEEGVVKGFGKTGEFRPGNNIQRGHAAKMVAKAFGLDPGSLERTLKDLPADVDVSLAIKTLASNGIVKGYKGSGDFKPAEEISRAEISKILCVAMVVSSIQDAEADPTLAKLDAAQTLIDQLPKDQDTDTLEYLQGRLDASK